MEIRTSIQPPTDLLAPLRANLRRIEEHRNEDLPPAALELKRLLLSRIANIESAITNLSEIIAKSSAPKKP